jgi:hypothetical protein
VQWFGLAFLPGLPPWTPVQGSCAPLCYHPHVQHAALRGPAWGHPRPRLPGRTCTPGLSVSGNVVTARLAAQQTDGTVRTYQGTYTVRNGAIVDFNVRQVGLRWHIR